MLLLIENEKKMNNVIKLNLNTSNVTVNLSIIRVLQSTSKNLNTSNVTVNPKQMLLEIWVFLHLNTSNVTVNHKHNATHT